MIDPQRKCDVRLAGPEDLLALLGVHARQEPGAESPDSASEAERRTWDLMMESRNLAVYLAAVNGDVVGTATMMLMPNVTYECAPSAIIEAVVVIHFHRRRGIATTVLRHALDDAKSAGCNKIQPLSHKRHSADGAHRLYANLGFQQEAEGFRLYLLRTPPAVAAARVS